MSSGFLCKGCGAASPVGIGYAGAPVRDTPDPACLGQHVCTADSGAATGCRPVCDRPGTVRVTVSGGYGGPMAHVMCPSHAAGESARVWPHTVVLVSLAGVS